MKNKLLEYLLISYDAIILTPLLLFLAFLFSFVIMVVVSILTIGQTIELSYNWLRGEHKRPKWINNGIQK